MGQNGMISVAIEGGHSYRRGGYPDAAELDSGLKFTGTVGRTED